MQRMPSGDASIQGGGERRVCRELAVADALVDPREVLIDDAAGAHVHVADLRVAHLTGRQSDRLAGCNELGVGIPPEQVVVNGRPRHGDRVVLTLRPDSPPVQDDQNERRDHSCLIAARPAYCPRSPSSSSIRSSWLYLAIRSVRLAEPVLICPAPVATARSAIVVSSVSPERCEMTLRYPASRAMATALSVSL